MFSFAVSEYIKNIFYNIVSILLLGATFVACAIFISNISAQTRINRFFEPYLDENSIITGYMGDKFNVDELGLVKVEKVLYSREKVTFSKDVKDLYNCVVYDDYTMEKLTPKLETGKIVTDGSGDLINAIISANDSGVKVGDVIEIAFYAVEGYDEGRIITVPIKITGIFSSGQRLFYGNGTTIGKDMPMKDLLAVYHYEQMGDSMVIIQEKELDKLPEPVRIGSWRSIIKFQDDITQEERDYNYRILRAYEDKIDDGHGKMDTFPKTSVLVERNEKETKNVYLTNLPLCIAIVSLVVICIICMVSIRNANSMKYYATLYICGMPINKAVILSGVEMTINSILAIALGMALIEIQMSKKIFGEINCVLEFEQWAIMIGIAIFMVVSVMLTTYKTLKERSPMSVLRDTAY